VWVASGTGHIDWIPDPATPTASDQPRTLSTDEHTSAGVLTHWLAPDHRPTPSTGDVQVNGPGWLILSTDGFWQRLPTAADLARAVYEARRANPTATAADIATTSSARPTTPAPTTT